MKRRKGLLLGLASMVMTHASSVMAAPVLLAEYTFEPADIAADNMSASASTVASGITAGGANFDDWSATVSDQLFDADLGAYARTNATNNVAFDPLQRELADAIAADNYLSVKLTGAGASVQRVTYTHAISNPIDAASYASYLFVGPEDFIAIEGNELVNSSGQPTTLLALATDSTPSITSQTVTLDTSGVATLQNFSGTVEIRIYLSDDTQSNAEIHSIDDILIEGVPEPSSLALLGLGGICLLRRRRSHTV